jgi:hypothetical protein
LSLLPGRPLSEVAAELGADQVVEMYRRMGAALADVHRIGQEAFGYLTTSILDPLPDNGSYMRRQFAKQLKEFENACAADPLIDLAKTDYYSLGRGEPVRALIQARAHARMSALLPPQPTLAASLTWKQGKKSKQSLW